MPAVRQLDAGQRGVNPVLTGGLLLTGAPEIGLDAPKHLSGKGSAPPWRPRLDTTPCPATASLKLAHLLLLVNAVIAAVSVGVAVLSAWSPTFTPSREIVLGVVCAVMVVGLLLAGNAVQGLASSIGAMGQGPGQPSEFGAFFVRHRAWCFYVGVNANFLALAVLVEMTGGFADSPFVALFVAMVLTAQQLCRFRTQSGYTILVGVALTGAMLAYERLDPPIAERLPKSLEVVFVVLSLAAGGFITLREKGCNYGIRRYRSAPTRAHVYKDYDGVWHCCLYRGDHRVDPVLSANGGRSPCDALNALVTAMGAEAHWGSLDAAPSEPNGNDFVAELRFVRDDPVRG